MRGFECVESSGRTHLMIAKKPTRASGPQKIVLKPLS